MRGSVSGNKIIPTTVDLDGDINVDPPTFTSGSLKAVTKTVTTTDITIPAGAKTLEVFNNSIDTDVVINGVNLKPQSRFALEAFQDMANYKMDFVPEVIISNPSNVDMWINLVYPSSSAVDPNTVL